MQKSKPVLLFGISCVLGLAAAAMAAFWLKDTSDAKVVQTVVATRNIDMGMPLQPDMFAMVSWPADGLPSGALRSVKDIENRVTRSAIYQGEPVLEARLAPKGTKGGLSALIPPGMRAITVKVNEVVGVAGFALPGSYVDILVNTVTNSQDAISKIVLERILVLAVAQDVQADQTKAKLSDAVTLQVTPEQAEMLDLARSVGTLSLVLRSQVDQAEVHTVGVNKPSLLGLRESGAALSLASTPSQLGTLPPAALPPLPPMQLPVVSKSEKKPLSPSVSDVSNRHQASIIPVYDGAIIPRSTY